MSIIKFEFILKFILKFAFLLVLGISVQSFAADIKKAMLTSVSGSVEVFAAAEADSKGNLVIFDGKKYVSKKANIGTKVFPGDILRTGNDGKLKAIYDNGDVFVLGPASAFTVPKKNTASQGPTSDVVYGKIRGIVDKNGPLSGIQIRTKSVVAGVRGTDLFVTFDPGTEVSEVHVLRGEVAVQGVPPKSPEKSTGTVKAANENTIFVKAGQKATAYSQDPVKENLLSGEAVKKAIAQVVIDLKPSTQQDLKIIQQTSTIEKPTLAMISSEQTLEIQKLEKTAKEKIIQDIRQGSPEVYKKIEGKNIENIEELNKAVVQDLSKSAPKISSKPKRSEFESNDDVYKKFFKPASE